MKNSQRLGQWIVNILEDKYNLTDLQVGDIMYRDINLNNVLYNITNEEYKQIILAYYAEDAWKNREKNLNYVSKIEKE